MKCERFQKSEASALCFPDLLMQAFLYIEIPNIFALKRSHNFKTLLSKLHLKAGNMLDQLNVLNVQKTFKIKD